MTRTKSIFAALSLAALASCAIVQPSFATPGDPLYANLVPSPGGTIQASASGAAGIQTATIPAVAGKTAYVCGVAFSAAGATTGLAVAPTITGLLGGTATFAFVFPAGVLVGATPLNLNFADQGGCLPASAANTAIAAILPSGGSGNTQASAAIWGYYR